jgi:hypothetical protein
MSAAQLVPSLPQVLGGLELEVLGRLELEGEQPAIAIPVRITGSTANGASLAIGPLIVPVSPS